MSVLGTCHGMLKLYQSVNMYFTVKKKKKKEENCVHFSYALVA